MIDNSNFILTIYIPSYNRINYLLKTLSNLIVQCASRSDILIIVQDNCSEFEYEKKIVKLLKTVKPYKFTIEINRNITNIGMSANILKGFELARSEWLLLLSDDDELYPDSIHNILNVVNNLSSDVDFVRFSSTRSHVSRPTQLNNFENFLLNSQSVNDFNSFIFISNGIYRLSSFRKELGVGYIHCHTFVPHFMMLANIMLNGGCTMISPYMIIDYKVPEVGYNYAMVAGLGVGAPKHIVLNLEKKLVRSFHRLFFPHNDIKVIIDLFYQTKYVKSNFEFFYLGSTYINYLKVSRNWFWRFFLKTLLFLKKIPYGFDIFIFFIQLIIPSVRRHIIEIKHRYHHRP